MNLVIINIIILLIIILIISSYCLNVRIPYPKNIINNFNEPIIRFVSYILIYCICVYNPILGLFSGVGILLLHIDYINLFIK
jgi:hypothetical protein